MRNWIDLITEATVMPDILYHATRSSNVNSIQSEGLRVSKYGEVHGKMDFFPPTPCIYLSRHPQSSNLHTSLFDGGQPVVVFAIDITKLDPDNFYPDDAIGYAFADEEILSSPRAVQRALGVSSSVASEIFEQLENATDENLVAILKPFWKWWLVNRLGGEVAYAANIPNDAIISHSIREG
jgi:hypothetical protein